VNLERWADGDSEGHLATLKAGRVGRPEGISAAHARNPQLAALTAAMPAPLGAACGRSDLGVWRVWSESVIRVAQE